MFSKKKKEMIANDPKFQKIQKQMHDKGVNDTFGTKKEILALVDILQEDENIEFATSGFHDNNTVLLVCSDKRVLFVDKGMIFGTQSNEIPLDMVNSVSYKQGLIMGKISITNGATTSEIDHVAKKDVLTMSNTIKEQSRLFKQQVNQQQVTTSVSDADQIRQFKKLFDDGIITQAEFDQKKKQLLNL